MSIGDTAKNILSFGARGRVKRKQEAFDDVRVQLENAIKDLEAARTKANQGVQMLVTAKENGVETLKMIRRISRSLATKDRKLGESDIRAVEVVGAEKIDETISNADLANSAARGVSAGASTALGTWALVGTYGTASTGTAISGLSGAAASNAILAWLGGGSLAAGGGGMAVGTAMLGGVVLVPTAIILAIFSHLSANKKIREIEERVAQALAAIEQSRGTQLMLEGLGRRIEELIRSNREGTIHFSYRIGECVQTALSIWHLVEGPSSLTQATWREVFHRPRPADHLALFCKSPQSSHD